MHPLVDLKVPDGSIAVHWFEQSSFALKDSAGTIVQIDPYFPRERPPDRFIYTEPPLDESALPTDFVLLTHAHGDHTCPESIRRIWETSDATQFVGPEESARQIAEETDVASQNISEIRAGESTTLKKTLTVHAVYAKPPEGDASADISPPDVTHLGYVIVSNGVTLYFSGDPINNFAEHDAFDFSGIRIQTRHRFPDKPSDRRRISVLRWMRQNGNTDRAKARCSSASCLFRYPRL